MPVNSLSSTTVAATTTSGASKAEKSAKTSTAAGSYAKAGVSSPATAEASNVQISQKAREMSLVRKAATEAPDIRDESLIADLKSKIASGEYKPNAAKISQGMVREAIQDELASGR